MSKDAPILQHLLEYHRKALQHAVMREEQYRIRRPANIITEEEQHWGQQRKVHLSFVTGIISVSPTKIEKEELESDVLLDAMVQILGKETVQIVVDTAKNMQSLKRR